MTKIYRIEIDAYQGHDETSAVPMTDFFLNKEAAEETLETINRLTYNELNNMLANAGAYLAKYHFGLNKPYIEEYYLLD